MEKIKMGLIGAGQMGSYHAKTLKKLEEQCEFVGLFDVNMVRAREIADQYHVRAFENPDDLLDEIEAVSIVVPATSLYNIASKCVARHICVLLEKPMAKNLQEASMLTKECNANQAFMQIGFIERFNPVLQKLKELVHSKKIVNVTAKRLSNSARIADTDVIQDLMIHDIDYVQYLIGSELYERESFGTVNSTNGFADYADAKLLAKNGVVVSLTASRIAEEKSRTITVELEAEYIKADLLKREIFFVDVDGHEFLYRPIDASTAGSDIIYTIPNTESLTSELYSFLTAVRTQSEPIVTLSDGFKALKLTEAIQNKVYKNSDSYCIRVYPTIVKMHRNM